MNDLSTRLVPTTGWQITLIAAEFIAFVLFSYLLIKKIKGPDQYTHFEGKLYWASLIILLANFVLYIYGTT